MKRAAPWLLAVACVLAALAAAWWAPALLGSLRHARALGEAAPVAYVVITAFGVMAFVPATVFCVAGGALFGFVRGVALSIAGGSLGAAGAFCLGRYAARTFFVERFAATPRLIAVDRAVAADGLRILFLLRLSPITPFNLLNYALGASSVRARDFAIALAGMLPGTLVACYGGHLAGEALALAGETETVWNSSYYLFLVVGFVATVLAAALVARAARRALRNVA